MPRSRVDNPEPDPPVTPASRVVLPFPRLPGPAGDRGESVMAARLREVFREHRANLVRFLQIRLGSEVDAQDAAQDAIFRLYQRHDALVDQDLRALLYVTARNIAIDRLRERRRAPVSFGADAATTATTLVDEAASPERIAIARQQLMLLRQLLKELPPRCEQAFVSYKLEGMEYGDIAARMGVTESMVRKYVLRALAHCAARFARMEGAP